jgi:hypothetical protein
VRTTGFTSLVEARTELVAHGFNQAFSSPGRPALWAKPGAKERDHRAIAIRNGETEYRIVPYPGPAAASPAELPALQARDKIIGYTEPPEAEASIIKPEDEDLSFLQ